MAVPDCDARDSKGPWDDGVSWSRGSMSAMNEEGEGGGFEKRSLERKRTLRSLLRMLAREAWRLGKLERDKAIQ